jgi:hypothetical protein
MERHHRIIRLVIAFAVGILLALYSFERISDPEPARQRAREEAIVMSAREILKSYVPAEGEIEIADPLAPNRIAGKVYIYPAENGWEVSGHYRRNASDRWHPFLMALSENVELVSLSVRDADEKLVAVAEADPKFSVTP